MIYYLLYPLKDKYFIFNVLRYITFRTIYSIITSLAMALVLGPYFIKKLSRSGMGQRIKTEYLGFHQEKSGTPTMGGIVIILSVTISTLLWSNLRVSYVWILLLSLISFGLIGFLDDWLKIKKGTGFGLPGRTKFLMQTLMASLIVILLMDVPSFSTKIAFPFLKKLNPDLGKFYLLFGILVIVGASNAVNLTDGLDGLAIGPLLVASATYMLFAYLSGHIKFAHYLQIPYSRGAGEAAIFAGAMVGSCLGFLWYNTYPAQVFMGDIGSLSLGASLGTLAMVVKQEILLVIVGGVFVLETMSVIIQVAFFRTTGKRVFKMAPIHHHFELKGWAEPKITVRFWIISFILALIAISTLKLR